MQAQAVTPSAPRSALSDITTKRQQQQNTPVAEVVTGSKPRPDAGAAGLKTPTEQGIVQADVQEQCLSAKGWLRGLVQECAANAQTPVRPSAPDFASVQVCTFLLGAGCLNLLMYRTAVGDMCEAFMLMLCKGALCSMLTGYSVCHVLHERFLWPVSLHVSLQRQVVCRFFTEFVVNHVNKQTDALSSFG